MLSRRRNWPGKCASWPWHTGSCGPRPSAFRETPIATGWPGGPATYRRFSGPRPANRAGRKVPRRGAGSRGPLHGVGQLSQGAQDQLYLALRLAVADLVAAKSRLPLLLDDPFVNCDEQRLERIRAALAELARQRQVIADATGTCSWRGERPWRSYPGGRRHEAGLFLGRAGTGKTHAVLQAIGRGTAATTPTGPPIVLLTPEQATFQMERALLSGGRSGRPRGPRSRALSGWRSGSCRPWAAARGHDWASWASAWSCARSSSARGRD